MMDETTPVTSMSWPDVQARWTACPRAYRRRSLWQAGRTAHQWWQDGVDLESIAIELSTFQPTAHLLIWNPFGPRPVEPRMRRLSIDRLERLLSQWYAEMYAVLDPFEAGLFLRGFLRQSNVRRAGIQTIQDNLYRHHTKQHTIDPHALYRSFFRRSTTWSKSGIYRGCWLAAPSVSVAQLAQAIAQAERDGTTLPDNTLLADVLGCRAAVICFHHPRPAQRLQNVFRKSPARRAFAAAQTLRALDLPTPSPYGFLEVGPVGRPHRSYYLCAQDDSARSGRQWMRTVYRHADETNRAIYRAQFQNRLLDLFHVGGYQPDLRFDNFLVHAQSDGSYRWEWIKLDRMTFDQALTPRRIIHAMIELNTSMQGRWLAEAERYAFLRELAPHFPFLLNPRALHTIRRKTLQRWKTTVDARD